MDRRHSPVTRAMVLGAMLPILLFTAACTDSGEAHRADASPAAGRPQACTAAIVNTYFEHPRFTGPGDTFDPEATKQVVTELLPDDCAVEPADCVRQVVKAMINSSREAAATAYASSPACTRP